MLLHKTINCQRALTSEIIARLNLQRKLYSWSVRKVQRHVHKCDENSNGKTKHLQTIKWNNIQRQLSKAIDNDIENEKVYVGPLAQRLRVVKVFSLTTSLVGLGAQPILLQKGMELGGTGLAIFLCSFAGIFTFVTPLLLHLITKNYVTEISYNKKEDEYTATTISLLLKRNQVKFRPEDVNVPEVPGMFTSFIVHKKPLFVDLSTFNNSNKNAEHYIRIMGYDKPIDYKLDIDIKEPLQEIKEAKRIETKK